MDAVGGEEAAERHLHRGGDGDVGGVHVGELDRRPAAALEVHHCEHHGRAGGVDELVDRVRDHPADHVGHGDRFHVVDGATVHGDPGRRQVDGTAGAVSGADEAELPGLGSAGRRGRGAGGFGAAGRLGGEHAPPGEELAVGEWGTRGHLVRHRHDRGEIGDRYGDLEDEGVGAVGQRQEGDDLAGGGDVEGGAQEQGGLSRTGVADGGRQVAHQSVDGYAERADDGLVGPAVGTGDDQVVDPVGLDAGFGQGRAEGLGTERDVAGLAELLLPLLGAHVAGRAPAVEELVGGGAGTDQLGDHRPVGVVAHQQGGGGVATGGLVGTAGQAGADVGGDHQGGRATGEGGAQGGYARTDGAAEVRSDHVAREAQGGVDRGGVGLVDIRRGHRGEPQRAGAGAGHPQGASCRLHPEGGGVLVVGRDRARALAAARAGHRGDGAAVESTVGQVGPVADDPSHGFRG